MCASKSLTRFGSACRGLAEESLFKSSAKVSQAISHAMASYFNILLLFLNMEVVFRRRILRKPRSSKTLQFAMCSHFDGLSIYPLIEMTPKFF